ncbi:MAG: calcium/sodium antiporter [Proteobacteria bacterium]|nr:calcium/sodium antiporter [Pseudomonadota bacterium]
MIMPALYIVLGFVMLMAGAEYAVRGAVAIANRLHIPSLIIGLTIVALGTSVPEFVVSIKSALNGNAGISVGNVIGSNIANVLLVLGASAVIYPISCDGKAFYRDFSFLFVVTLLFAFFVVNGKFINWNGWVLLGFLAVFLIYNYFGAQKDENPEDEIPSQLVNSSWWMILAALGGGLAAIAYGAEFLVGGAVDVARIFGVSEEIIGVTIVAVGTSAPELATSCVAAFRRQNGIALGNVIGSNIWNIVFVMGATTVITDVQVADQFILFDVWVMMFASFMLLPIMMFKNKITRLEGLFMLACFIAYMYAQVLINRGGLVLM